MKRLPILLFLLLFFSIFSVSGQSLTLSENAEISILNIGPGKNLYDKFGHTAIRIKDTRLDLVYNYGVYDFNTPNFYTKFAQGKLLYLLDVRRYDIFVESYKRQNRWVEEHTLNLTYGEKRACFEYLQENAKKENRAYLYDFFYDNCATRPRDMLDAVLGDKLTYNDSYLTEEHTFRELIGQNVSSNSWGSLGMDVAIGAVTDIKATPWQHQFLPNYFSEASINASITNTEGITKPLIKHSEVIFQNSPQQEPANFFLSPLFIFGILGLIILFVTYRDYKNDVRSRLLDVTIFFVTGLVGIILLLLWFATDHSATAHNYNLLWATPLSLFFIFTIGRKHPRRWVQRYILFLLLLLALLCLHAITGVQRFAIGFIPLFIALGVRYIYVAYFLKRNAR